MTALYKTAEMGKLIYPEASNTILKNTYVDDIIDSFSNTIVAGKVIKEIDKLIEKGGFVIKKWVTSDINTVDEAIDIKVFLKDHSILGISGKNQKMSLNIT